MNKQIFDCLKRERDVCVKIIIPSQNAASRCTPAYSFKYKYQSEGKTARVRFEDTCGSGERDIYI